MSTPTKSIGQQARDYVSAARERKAQAMAKTAYREGLHADKVRAFTDEQWSMLAALSGVNNPSLQTRELTLLKLDWLEENGNPGRVA